MKKILVYEKVERYQPLLKPLQKLRESLPCLDFLLAQPYPQEYPILDYF